MRTSTVGCVLLLTLTGIPAAAQTVYIAFGDSITEGRDDDVNPPGYPPKLEALLDGAGEPSSVENFGLGGERTTEGVTRIEEALALTPEAEVLLLMEGTNDIHHGISQETTITNLGTMARKASNAGVSTLHATLIPRAPDAEVDRQNVRNNELALLIRDLAATTDRRLADPFFVFSQQPNLFEEYYTDRPTDTVGHPNNAGYHLLAQVFADVILDADTVPPREVFVRPADQAQDVNPDTGLRVELIDLLSGVNTETPTLLLNGEQLATSVRTEGNRVVLTHVPREPLAGVLELAYRAEDLAPIRNAVTRTVSEFTIEGTEFLTGDLNLDGRVDGADLVILGWRFGGRRGADSRYFEGFDLNGDGVLDGQDVAILARNFGESSF